MGIVVMIFHLWSQQERFMLSLLFSQLFFIKINQKYVVFHLKKVGLKKMYYLFIKVSLKFDQGLMNL